MAVWDGDRRRNRRKGSGLKRRLAVILVAVTAAFGAGAIAPAVGPVALAPSASAHTCSSSYRHAIIGGAHKCLRRGQFCAARYDRQYHRYGFHCHRYDSSVGRYRLT